MFEWVTIRRDHTGSRLSVPLPRTMSGPEVEEFVQEYYPDWRLLLALSNMPLERED